jgi:hypothetical protein
MQMTKSSLAEKEIWAERIQEQQASGLSIKKWCQSKKLWPHAFYYWKKALAPITFQEIADTSRCRVEITYQGVKIHLESSSLKQCLSVLKELTC